MRCEFFEDSTAARAVWEASSSPPCPPPSPSSSSKPLILVRHLKRSLTTLAFHFPMECAETSCLLSGSPLLSRGSLPSCPARYRHRDNRRAWRFITPPKLDTVLLSLLTLAPRNCSPCHHVTSSSIASRMMSLSVPYLTGTSWGVMSSKTISSAIP